MSKKLNITIWNSRTRLPKINTPNSKDSKDVIKRMTNLASERINKKVKNNHVSEEDQNK